LFQPQPHLELMSDNEGPTKKSGYRLEYASSARAKCKGAKPCAGTPIPKGAMRVGTIVDFRGNTSFAWRHWGCTTPRIITNMKEKFSNPDDLDGFEDLNDEDKERVRRAWDQGHVDDDDIPPTARKPADAEGDEDKPKKKRAPAKKKAEAEGDEEEKPKKKRAAKSKKTEDEVEDEGETEEIEEKPKRAAAKKPRTKKHEEEDAEKPKGTRGPRKVAAKKKKDESEASGEDFAEELAEVDDEPEVDVDEPAGKKRKRPASTKQAAATKKPRAASSRTKKSRAVAEEDEDDE